MRLVDEAAMWNATRHIDDREPGRHPREWIAASGVSPKAAHATLEKWGRKGWYDYGVSLDLGWRLVAGPLPTLARGDP